MVEKAMKESSNDQILLYVPVDTYVDNLLLCIIYIFSNATSVNELQGVISSHVTDDTFELPVRRSHLIEDTLRGLQRRSFAPQKTLVVSNTILLLASKVSLPSCI